MKRLEIFLLVTLLLLLTVGCEKFVSLQPPKGELTDKAVFSDSTGAVTAVLGLYINMAGTSSRITSGAMTLLAGLTADELIPVSSSVSYGEFYLNDISPENGINSSVWSNAYKQVYGINATIEGLEKSDGISNQLRQSLIAEAKVIRSFIYFHLVQLYGPVPLVLQTDYRINRLLSRTAVDIILETIKTDLESAKEILSPAEFRPTRVSYYAVTAFLAKTYFFLGDYKAAADAATECIDSGRFSLADIDSVFLATSPETIWAVSPTDINMQTADGFEFVPRSNTALPKYEIATGLREAFHMGDLRKLFWTANVQLNGEEYTYPFKYKANSNDTELLEHYVLFRLAEQYLIRAESRLLKNDIVGAKQDLAIVRDRAGLTDVIVTVNPIELEQLIESEYRTEMFCEWGNRWMNLKRKEKLSEELGLSKPAWRETAELYPIPQTEINTNVNLVQNLGY